MNKKTVFILIVIIIVIAGILYYLYRHNELSQQDIDKKYSNLNIYAEDSSGKMIITGYIVIVNNAFYSSGKTLLDGAILEKIPINSTYRVYSSNLENQSFYSVFVGDFISQNIPSRITLRPIVPGKLIVSQKEKISSNNESATLNIYSQMLWKNPGFCIKYSTRFIYVRVSNYTQIDKPNIYRLWDKCYDMHIDNLTNSDADIVLNYNIYGTLTVDDFLKIVIFDKDDTYTGLLIDDDGRDIAGKNIEYEVIK